MILAIDIGGTKVAAALFGQGKLLGKRTACSTMHSDYDKLSSVVADMCRDWIDRVQAIGIATAGLVEGDKVTFVSRAGRPSIDLGAAIRDISGIQPVILNDAWAGALGEYRHGDFASEDTVVYITVSTGIGAGIIHKGKLLTSQNGLMAHVGHSSTKWLDDEDLVCACGRRNCLELVASGTAMARRATRKRGTKTLTAEIFAAAPTDPEMDRIIEDGAKALSETIVDIRALLGAGQVIIGGSVGLAAGFADRVRAHIDRLPPHWRAVIRTAELGADAELFGAAEAARYAEMRCR